MSDPYLGEVRMFAFDFAPRNWAKCDGELLPIEQNQALFSILSTTYGGDGRTDFALPDLRGRTPLHKGNGISLGQYDGEEGVALTTTEIPAHTHTAHTASANAGSNDPTDRLLAQTANLYGAASNLVSMASTAIGSTGGGQEHNNMQPYLVINFCISMAGTFPPRN